MVALAHDIEARQQERSQNAELRCVNREGGHALLDLGCDLCLGDECFENVTLVLESLFAECLNVELDR